MQHPTLITRRKALQVGGLGMLGLTVPKLLRAASWRQRIWRVA